jgi:hypothetical protein
LELRELSAGGAVTAEAERTWSQAGDGLMITSDLVLAKHEKHQHMEMMGYFMGYLTNYSIVY